MPSNPRHFLIMILADFNFKTNLNKILSSGTWDSNPRPKYKDGTPAKSKYVTQVFEQYNLENFEFPITTLRNTAIRTGILEILWIYQLKSNDLSVAKNMGINWWDEWDIGDGTIGQRYGATVDKWNLIDKLLIGLKEDPFSRRHIMNLYQESDLISSKGLFPCAYETIWSVRESKKGNLLIDMTLIQRSSDYLVANYINKSQYCALMLMVAGHLGYEVGVFSHFVQNLHIYDRHMPAAEEILNREPMLDQPKIELRNKKSFYDYSIDDFKTINTSKIEKISSQLELAI